MTENNLENIVEGFLKVLSSTKSSTDFVFDNLELEISTIKTKITLNGKISIEVRPLHD